MPDDVVGEIMNERNLNGDIAALVINNACNSIALRSLVFDAWRTAIDMERNAARQKPAKCFRGCEEPPTTMGEESMSQSSENHNAAAREVVQTGELRTKDFAYGLGTSTDEPGASDCQPCSNGIQIDCSSGCCPKPATNPGLEYYQADMQRHPKVPDTNMMVLPRQG